MLTKQGTHPPSTTLLTIGQDVMVYMDTTSYLTKLFIAQRTHCVIIYENDILEANHQFTLFMIFPRISIDKFPIANSLVVETLPSLFLTSMILLHTIVTPTMDLSHLVFLAYSGNLPCRLVKENSTSSLFSISSTSWLSISWSVSTPIAS